MKLPELVMRRKPSSQVDLFGESAARESAMVHSLQPAKSPSSIVWLIVQINAQKGIFMQIENDTVVSIDYKLTGPDGNVIDTSDGREPLAYLHGAGNIIPGLER